MIDNTDGDSLRIIFYKARTAQDTITNHRFVRNLVKINSDNEKNKDLTNFSHSAYPVPQITAILDNGYFQEEFVKSGICLI